MEKLIKVLKSLPKEFLLVVIHELMKDETLSFTELAEVHNQYLKDLKEKQNDKYYELLKRTTHIAFDFKKNRDKNIKDTLHWLLDKGQINATHEQIDKM